jgi:hypothetical protein
MDKKNMNKIKKLLSVLGAGKKVHNEMNYEEMSITLTCIVIT